MTCDELKIFSLFEAVKNGKKEEVEGLISKGADVNSKNKNNLTPLQVAILKNNVEMVEFLVDHGANINEKDPDRGGTPLDLASNLHREEIINFLKSNEAMTCDELKIFSLFEAAQNGNIETLKKLISRGADINRKDRLGNTALHYAVVSDNFEIVKYLIEAGASILIRDRKGRTPDWYVKSSRIYSFFEELKKKQLEELKKKQQILKSFEI